MKKNDFLVIDDDELSRLSLKISLTSIGNIFEAKNKDEALSQIKAQPFDIVFIDLDLENELDGLAIIEMARKTGAYTIVLSGREDNECIEQAYSLGCHDYLTKPFSEKAFKLIIDKFRLLKNNDLRDFFASKFITQNEYLINHLAVLENINLSNTSIFIQGETGTGKTYLAKLIHSLSGNLNNFIHLNCSEIPENLIESELFGYVKGAFSGAEKSNAGKLKLADGGTLFLDEIGTMPLTIQKKLLKVIEEKEFYPLGSNKKESSDFKLISASCDNINELIEEKKFRPDLYFRIEGSNIYLTPIRERPEDIELQINHFLRSSPRKVIIKDCALNSLLKYNWPGNTRELKKVISNLQHKSSGIISKKELPSKTMDPLINLTISNSNVVNIKTVNEIKKHGLAKVIANFEEEIIEHFYQKNNQHVRSTLRELKISSNAFYKAKCNFKE